MKYLLTGDQKEVQKVLQEYNPQNEKFVKNKTKRYFL